MNPERTDPEPWVHRWPHDVRGVRTQNEKCTVDRCHAINEPRTPAQLAKAYDRQPYWTVRVVRKIKAGIEWLRRGA